MRWGEVGYTHTRHCLWEALFYRRHPTNRAAASQEYREYQLRGRGGRGRRDVASRSEEGRESICASGMHTHANVQRARGLHSHRCFCAHARARCSNQLARTARRWRLAVPGWGHLRRNAVEVSPDRSAQSQRKACPAPRTNAHLDASDSRTLAHTPSTARVQFRIRTLTTQGACVRPTSHGGVP